MVLTDNIENRGLSLYDDFSQGDIYSVVVTLDPEIYKKRCRTQYRLTKDRLLPVCTHCSKHMIVVPELTEKCNVHYHCILSVEKGSYDIDLLQDVLKGTKWIGMVHVNSNKIMNQASFNRTIEYVFKEIKRTQALLKENNILCLKTDIKHPKAKPEYITLRLDGEEEDGEIMYNDNLNL